MFFCLRLDVNVILFAAICVNRFVCSMASALTCQPATVVLLTGRTSVIFTYVVVQLSEVTTNIVHGVCLLMVD